MKSKILGLLSVSLVFVLCGWLYSRQGVLRFASLEIEPLNDEDLSLAVKRKIAPYLGANLLTLSLADLEKSLQQDTRIRKVLIRRKLPSTLSLKIIPRLAIAFSSKSSVVSVIGDEGLPLDGYQTKEKLPNWVAYDKCGPLCREKVSDWLSSLRVNQADYYRRIERFEWIENNGLIFNIRTQNQAQESIQVEMGTDDFLSKWSRVKLVVDLISERQIHGESLMALGDGQVVISGVKNLHNLKNELNLKEMVRRATQPGDTRASAR